MALAMIRRPNQRTALHIIESQGITNLFELSKFIRVDKADDHDLAQLYKCLGKQPGVIGVSDPMDMTR